VRALTYRCWSHVALVVGQLRQAEEFYGRLFGLEVAFREAEAADGWRTLRGGTGWDSFLAAGIEPQMSSLRRDGIVLALEAAGEEREAAGEERHPGRLSHIGITTDQPDLDELRLCAPGLGCRIVTYRDGLLILDDPYGIRWEVSTARELTSTGARTGRWLHVPG
jgi:catechol 2,3-dioxygenase-like lactoylglutathione lyase family enzyme